MNNKLYGVVAIVLGLALAGAGGFIYGQSGTLGATINYSNSKNQAVLYNSFESLLADVTAIRSPLSNVSGTTATFDVPSLVPSNATTSLPFATTTAFAGVVAGDFVLVSPVTSTLTFRDVQFTAQGCGTDIVCIFGLNTSSSAVNLPSATYNLRLLPSASFNRPNALITSSSTSN